MAEALLCTFAVLISLALISGAVTWRTQTRNRKEDPR